MSSPSLVMVLAEDRRQQNFVRVFLRELGFPIHAIDLRPLPASRGCGEQWVREHYAKELADCRHRARGRRAATALIVVVDADTAPIQHRSTQLQNALSAAAQPPLDPQELIAHFIPKRNLETWVTFLNGSAVNENDDYKPRVTDDDIRPAALKFYQLSRPNAADPADAPPSLLAAIPSARRLDPR